MLSKRTWRHEHSGNARLVRNMIEPGPSAGRQSACWNKKVKLSGEDLMLITREDIRGFQEE